MCIAGKLYLRTLGQCKYSDLISKKVWNKDEVSRIAFRKFKYTSIILWQTFNFVPFKTFSSNLFYLFVLKGLQIIIMNANTYRTTNTMTLTAVLGSKISKLER